MDSGLCAFYACPPYLGADDPCSFSPRETPSGGLGDPDGLPQVGAADPSGPFAAARGGESRWSGSVGERWGEKVGEKGVVVVCRCRGGVWGGFKKRRCGVYFNSGFDSWDLRVGDWMHKKWSADTEDKNPGSEAQCKEALIKLQQGREQAQLGGSWERSEDI